jgi:hypothetical protein
MLVATDRDVYVLVPVGTMLVGATVVAVWEIMVETGEAGVEATDVMGGDDISVLEVIPMGTIVSPVELALERVVDALADAAVAETEAEAIVALLDTASDDSTEEMDAEMAEEIEDWTDEIEERRDDGGVVTGTGTTSVPEVDAVNEVTVAFEVFESVPVATIVLFAETEFRVPAVVEAMAAVLGRSMLVVAVAVLIAVGSDVPFLEVPEVSTAPSVTVDCIEAGVVLRDVATG